MDHHPQTFSQVLNSLTKKDGTGNVIPDIAARQQLWVITIGTFEPLNAKIDVDLMKFSIVVF